MKKVVKFLKRVLVFIGTLIFSMHNKVRAMSNNFFENAKEFGPGVYDYPVTDLYGVPTTQTIPAFWILLKGLILPIIFIIGTVVYLKKSSSNTLRKIITIVISLVVVILICLGTNYIIINSI